MLRPLRIAELVTVSGGALQTGDAHDLPWMTLEGAEDRRHPRSQEELVRDGNVLEERFIHAEERFNEGLATMNNRSLPRSERQSGEYDARHWGQELNDLAVDQEIVQMGLLMRGYSFAEPGELAPQPRANEMLDLDAYDRRELAPLSPTPEYPIPIADGSLGIGNQILTESPMVVPQADLAYDTGYFGSDGYDAFVG